MSSIRAERAAATSGRLLDAAADILCTQGAASVSIQRVADRAGASKGLVHYHFADKDALLAACADRLTLQLVGAEARSLAHSTAHTALDDLWAHLVDRDSLARRRALVALGSEAAPETRTAFAHSLEQRRRAALETVARLEVLLDFTPTVPRQSLAIAFTAFADGLVHDPQLPAGDIQRRAFDAFWLAVLSLTTN